MTLHEYFKTYIKNIQTRHLAKTWHEKVAVRQIERNNFLATGDLQKAKEFASTFSSLETRDLKQALVEPITIFTAPRYL